MDRGPWFETWWVKGLAGLVALILLGAAFGIYERQSNPDRHEGVAFVGFPPAGGKSPPQEIHFVGQDNYPSGHLLVETGGQPLRFAAVLHFRVDGGPLDTTAIPVWVDAGDGISREMYLMLRPGTDFYDLSIPFGYGTILYKPELRFEGLVVRDLEMLKRLPPSQEVLPDDAVKSRPDIQASLIGPTRAILKFTGPNMTWKNTSIRVKRWTYMADPSPDQILEPAPDGTRVLYNDHMLEQRGVEVEVMRAQRRKINITGTLREVKLESYSDGQVLAIKKPLVLKDGPWTFTVPTQRRNVSTTVRPGHLAVSFRANVSCLGVDLPCIGLTGGTSPGSLAIVGNGMPLPAAQPTPAHGIGPPPFSRSKSTWVRSGENQYMFTADWLSMRCSSNAQASFSLALPIYSKTYQDATPHAKIDAPTVSNFGPVEISIAGDASAATKGPALCIPIRRG